MRGATILLFLHLPTFFCWSETDSAWVLTTDTLPSHTSQSKFNPTLANGQLAVTPYLQPGISVPPTITVNCLYNGDSWNSHRARLPNYSNYLLQLKADGEETVEESYSLDLAKAEFRASFSLSDFLVTHQVVVHRTSGITEGLLTEYRSIRCLNYVKFLGNTDYDFPQELNGIN